MEELQTDEATRARWIFYSALDAKATWELYHSLQVESLLQIDALPLPSLLGSDDAMHYARHVQVFSASMWKSTFYRRS